MSVSSLTPATSALWDSWNWHLEGTHSSFHTPQNHCEPPLLSHNCSSSAVEMSSFFMQHPHWVESTQWSWWFAHQEAESRMLTGYPSEEPYGELHSLCSSSCKRQEYPLWVHGILNWLCQLEEKQLNWISIVLHVANGDLLKSFQDLLSVNDSNQQACHLTSLLYSLLT